MLGTKRMKILYVADLHYSLKQFDLSARKDTTTSYR